MGQAWYGVPATTAGNVALIHQAGDVNVDAIAAVRTVTDPLGIALLCGGALTLFLAGVLLWWREGARLFTDGLIAAIVACF